LTRIAPIRPLQLCADGGYQLRLGVLGVPLIMVPDRFNINFVLLLWFGIYLHLVTANKNLTNLLKAMLSLNPYY
jgi:hypothetical protein